MDTINKHTYLTKYVKGSYMQHIWTSINLWTIPGHGLPFEATANRSAVASDWIVTSLLSRLPKTKAAPLRKVLLVVLLGSVELLGRQNLCNNRSVHDLLVFLQRFTCCLLLLRCVEVDSGSVLRSHITTLPIADEKRNCYGSFGHKIELRFGLY